MSKLAGKVAVITAATSGMALATAKRFVEEGAFVYITGRRQGALDEAVKAIGRNVVGVQGDAGKLEDLDRLFGLVKEQQGRLDVLFSSAGTGDLETPLEAVTEAHFDETFDLNVRGTLFAVQKAVPLMGPGGSIILNGSIAGVKGIGGASVYSASKAAVRSFARTLTAELKDRQIRINILSPGPIDTGAFEGVPAERKAAFASMVPMGRLGAPDEIATAALFLASGDSSFVTGIELTVDGGLAQV